MENGVTIRCKVPKGFCTDFYSVPAFARPLIPKSQVGWNQAAVVHDRIYAVNVVDVFDPEVGAWSPASYVVRHTADQMMQALMEQFEAPELSKEIIYLAVRLGGKQPWEDHRNGNI